ncbi:MAG: isoleucine--tRNA ligase [Nitrospiraceae bacterium]|nr:isoleucine--tRNA ligase [Nitrospiraceae bacterium]
MSKETDYKDTLNLPATDFPMKANLPQREPMMLKTWQEAKLYAKILEKNRDGEKFILHDGPPYANGHIHMGHALNKVLKDIIIKYKTMKGFNSPYVPGWDCHGLPIELQVDKNLGQAKNQTTVLEKRRLCRQYAAGFVDIQREEFVRLGVFGLWEAPYLTMTNDYEADIVAEFNLFAKSGYLYKGKKPVHWCPSCVTALADAEVEYAEKKSTSVYVRFRLLDEDAAKLGLTGAVYLVIWTTTPWTLPANLALAVNPEVDYAAFTANGETHILAENLYEPLKEILHIAGEKVLEIKGIALRGLRAKHPFIDRLSRVITGKFVTTEEGAGIVHIAPGHGEDDYAAGIENGLEIYAPVDDYGKFRGTGVERIEGEFVFKANPKIIEMLREKGALLAEKEITHSYPHCWRCKKPVIFRATEQWFISMEYSGLRDKCLAEIEKVKWVPEWGKGRIYGMVERRPDWCISRQRAWGVPVALLSCAGCGRTVTEPAVLDKTEEFFRRLGSDVWFEKPASEFIPEGFTCPGCGGREFTKEKDILDVWFDSGVSHHAVLERRAGLAFPAEMYLEGSDQHRGWFQSSLITATALAGSAPYKTVLTHGFVVDGKGHKMSKSLGNVVAPEDIIKKHGAEILRLWVSAEDYRDDIRLSPEILERLTEAYRKIRNTARFLLGNTHDFSGGHDFEGGDTHRGSLLEIDRWALSRLQGLIAGVERAYEDFEFHEVYHRLYNFCVVDMSSFYLDILKDRLYTFRRDSEQRRAAQWVLGQILLAMAKLMAPVLSFTAEEIWGYINPAAGRGKDAESVFLSSFPAVDDKLLDAALEEKWSKIIAVRNEVNRALEIKRQQRMIGNSLEARVLLYAPDDIYALLKDHENFLPALFIVSQAEIRKISGEELMSDILTEAFRSEEIKGLVVDVLRAEGEKCPRCWMRDTSVGKNPEGVCDRCRGNIS